MGRSADAPVGPRGSRWVVMAGDGADTTEIEDVLDRLEAWHRRSAPVQDSPGDDRSETPVGR